MPPFSKRDSSARSEPRSGGFSTPASRVRQRGSTEGPDEFAVRAPAPRPPAAATAPTPVAGAGGSAAAGAAGAPVAQGSRSGPARHDEVRLCGLTAVRARFARDPGSIQRLFFDYDTGRQVGIMSKVLAQAKKIYRCVEPAELEKVAGTIHHGGIVAVVTTKPLRSATATDVQHWAKKREPLLILDRIGNAHNLGAIARTTAFFGLPRIVIPDEPGAAKPNDAAYRVAEGGLEHVEVWTTPKLVTLVRDLTAAGYDVVGAATRGGKADVGAKRGADAKPVALVLGNEEQGLAPDVVAACSRLVTIPGSGAVESLNVSVAAAVLLWELVARK